MAQHHIDIYCERLGPGLWAEPLNAVTNIAFIVAAALLVRVLRGEDPAVRRDPAVIALVVLVFLIGIGSGLFHTFAVRWAGLADVIPIVLFILLYLFLALWRLVGLPAWGAFLGMIAVLGLLMGLPRLFGFGFGAYGVALAAMFLVGGFLAFVRGHPAGSPILVTAGVFALSLSLRTADLPLCELLPMGTHFLWHILNAVVLYRLTRTMMTYGSRRASSVPRQPAKAGT